MRAGFSEFSFGFALSFEITNACFPNGVIGAPIFPSLLQEKKSGIDVDFQKIGWPLFLQFKLADYMGSKRSSYWSEYGSGYYRASVYQRKRSNQHNLLIQLSKREPETYYAISAFHQQSDFNNLFASNKIFMNTAFVPLSELPELDDDEQHVITFRDAKSTPEFKWHSVQGQPLRGGEFGESWSHHLQHLIATTPRTLNLDYLNRLRSSLFGIIQDFSQRELYDLPIAVDDNDPRSVIRDVRFMLQTQFGVEAFVVQKLLD